MERSVALKKKLGKLLGKKLGYRVDDKAPKADEREAAKAEFDLACQERNALKEKRDARHRAILEADAEYQSLFAAHRAASDRADKLSSLTRRYKFTVGVCGDMFFHVRAQGDTWEEVIDKLKLKTD